MIDPCPFCGSIPHPHQSRLDDIGFCGTQRVWYYMCSDGSCQIRGPLRETITEALEAWNSRKP